MRHTVALSFVLPIACTSVCTSASGFAQQHAQHHGVMYHAPQWSQDGQWILASSMPDGSDVKLYLIPVDRGAIRQLTQDTVPDEFARWSDRGRRSPDGVAELREEQGAIVLVDRKTGARRPLTSGTWAEQGSFSPDGRSLVYEQRSTADPHRVETSNIVVARADGSEARIVSSGTDPSWSPDGQRLLFKVWDARDRQLLITTIRADGTDSRRLGLGVHPQWSPDGRRIAFMRDAADGTHIWVMDADGGRQRCVTCAAREDE